MALLNKHAAECVSLLEKKQNQEMKQIERKNEK